MKVEVTAEDIAKGRPLNPYYCPVGLAIARALGVDPGEHTFAVGVWVIRLGKLLRWLPPKAVDEFTYAYDHVQDVEPFTFDIPQEALTRGGL